MVVVYSLLHEQCTHQCEDGIELGESCIDECLCHHVVALCNALNTSGAHLALTDGREHTAESHEGADAEHQETVCCHTAHEGEESHETIDTLRCGQTCENHECGRLARIDFQTAFCGLSGNTRAEGTSDTGQNQHHAEAEITQ